MNSHILLIEHRSDRRIELTVKEFDLLDYLISHPQQVMTREQILNHIWDHRFPIDSNILDVYIRHLRLKLEAAHEQRLIHTVRGVGYVLRLTRSQAVSKLFLSNVA
jgi:DNA-binding response OmpR family regulator